MNTPSTEQSHELLDRLQTMAFLQNLLWQEAITISDELLDCELDAVLRQVPALAVATSGPNEDLTYGDLDKFVEDCRRIVTVRSIKIDLSRPRHSRRPQTLHFGQTQRAALVLNDSITWN